MFAGAVVGASPAFFFAAASTRSQEIASRITRMATQSTSNIVRCEWPKNPLAVEYHDREWGVPVHEDSRLFESLTLSGAQAGLSWDTILKKRERYRKVFGGFDP